MKESFSLPPYPLSAFPWLLLFLFRCPWGWKNVSSKKVLNVEISEIRWVYNYLLQKFDYLCAGD